MLDIKWLAHSVEQVLPAEVLVLTLAVKCSVKWPPLSVSGLTIVTGQAARALPRSRHCCLHFGRHHFDVYSARGTVDGDERAVSRTPPASAASS